MTLAPAGAAPPSAPGATTTVCLIAKNEAPYLVEWLAHYLCLGFDRIVVYDNGSTDGTAALVQCAAALFPRIVHYRPWPDQPGQAPQLPAYRDAVARCDTEWIAFFDADEFLVLKEDRVVGSFLDGFPPDAGSVAVNWLLFGSSGEVEHRDELQALRFRLAARNGPRTKNQFVKSLSRLRAIDDPRAHTVLLRPGFHAADADGKPVVVDSAKTAGVAHSRAQLNHYIVRSRAEYADKQRRGNPARADDSPSKFAYRDDEFWRHHDTNEVADDAIDPWVARAAPLRAAIARAAGLSSPSRTAAVCSERSRAGARGK
jgi:glycosyltransferase involved in cell wall biosynthesis